MPATKPSPPNWKIAIETGAGYGANCMIYGKPLANAMPGSTPYATICGNWPR